MKCWRSELVWGTSNPLLGEGGSARETWPPQQPGLGQERKSIAWTTKDGKFRLNKDRRIPVANLGERFHWTFIPTENLPTPSKFGEKTLPIKTLELVVDQGEATLTPSQD